MPAAASAGSSRDRYSGGLARGRGRGSAAVQSCVPGAASAVDHVELAACLGRPSRNVGADEPARERGHARRAAAPDRASAGPAAVEVAAQPLVRDRAAGAQPLQQAAQEGQVASVVRRRADQRPGMPVAARRAHSARGLRRVVERDLGGGGTGQLQGAAVPGAQPELHDGGEGQPLADQLPGLRGRRLSRRRAGASTPGPVVQVGRHHRGAAISGSRRGRDHVGDQVVAAGSARRARSWLASSARSENVYDRLATNPARCAASCTESLNSSVLRSVAGPARRR